MYEERRNFIAEFVQRILPEIVLQFPAVRHALEVDRAMEGIIPVDQVEIII